MTEDQQTGVNPAWPIAAVFSGFAGPDLALNQDVTVAPTLTRDWRAVVLILAIATAGIWLIRKGR